MHFIAITSHNGQLISCPFEKDDKETVAQLLERIEKHANASLGVLPTGREIMVINVDPNALIKHIHSK